MGIVVQKSAFKPGVYRGKPLTAAKLREYAEGTNKALAAGVPIPALERHAKLGANDAETNSVHATAGAGWLKSVEVEADGSLSWKIDVPQRIETGIKDGTVRFTSPEFRNNYEAADGRYRGPIVRHVAFTPVPKTHDQGEIALAMSEDACQFSEADYQGPADEQFSEYNVPAEHKEHDATLNKHGYSHVGELHNKENVRSVYRHSNGMSVDVTHGSDHWQHSGGTSGNGHQSLSDHLGKTHAPQSQFSEDSEFPTKKKPDDEAPPAAEEKPPEIPATPKDPPNPDAPPKTTDSSKVNALREGCAQLGLVLPSDFDFGGMAPEAVDLMVAVVNTALKAKQSSEAKPETPAEPPEQEANPSWAFSEEELETIPAEVQPAYLTAKKIVLAQRAEIAKRDQQITQFAEERAQHVAEKAANAREKAVANVSALKLPPGLRKTLLEKLKSTDAVQFSEDGEQPTLTIEQAGEMFAKSLPKSVQFDETPATDAEHPDGEQFFEGDNPKGIPKTPEAAKKLIEKMNFDFGMTTKPKPAAV